MPRSTCRNKDWSQTSSPRKARAATTPRSDRRRMRSGRPYRTKLEQLSRDMTLYDVLERTLPALQVIFMDALSALETKQIRR